MATRDLSGRTGSVVSLRLGRDAYAVRLRGASLDTFELELELAALLEVGASEIFLDVDCDAPVDDGVGTLLAEARRSLRARGGELTVVAGRDASCETIRSPYGSLEEAIRGRSRSFRVRRGDLP